jgi:hypothetical protein
MHSSIHGDGYFHARSGALTDRQRLRPRPRRAGTGLGHTPGRCAHLSAGTVSQVAPHACTRSSPAVGAGAVSSGRMSPGLAVAIATIVVDVVFLTLGRDRRFGATLTAVTTAPSDLSLQVLAPAEVATRRRARCVPIVRGVTIQPLGASVTIAAIVSKKPNMTVIAMAAIRAECPNLTITTKAARLLRSSRAVGPRVRSSSGSAVLPSVVGETDAPRHTAGSESGEARLSEKPGFTVVCQSSEQNSPPRKKGQGGHGSNTDQHRSRNSIRVVPCFIRGSPSLLEFARPRRES